MAQPLPPVQLLGHSSSALRFHFPASLGSTLVTRFLATMDALTPAEPVLRATAAMNAVLSPGRSPCFLRSRFLPFCLQPPAGEAAAFCRFTVSLSTRTSFRWPAPPRAEPFPLGEAGAAERTSLGARRLVPPSGRIEFTLFRSFTNLCYGLAVHLRQLPTPCRHGAVAFSHRPVNQRPDGDFHPAM